MTRRDRPLALPPQYNMHEALVLIAKGLSLIGLELPIPRQNRARRHVLTITRLCRLYQTHAEEYYPDTGGSSARESKNIARALRPLQRMFGRTPVVELGPLRLKLVRDEMVRLGWCRRHVNHQVGRIKRMLRWATENELIPGHVYHAVQSVPGLKSGRTPAVDHPLIKPVSDEAIAATVPFLSSVVAAMVQLQLLTGMRPGEVVMMRTCDLDRSKDTWLYRPARHKTQHHGHERYVFLGPRARRLIEPLLQPDQPEAHLFSPLEADRERRERLTELRTTPVSCGNRVGTNRKRRPKKRPGKRYEVSSYRRAIAYACDRAFPVPQELDSVAAAEWRRRHRWHPHRLRHTAATRLRHAFGLDAAQAVLGHKTLAVTQVYAERHEQAAREAMLAVG